MVSINISLENISEIKQLPLHDAELLSIICDYSNYAVNVRLKLDSPRKKNVDAEISLLNVKLLNVPIDEPWGTGIYIYKVSCCISDAQTEHGLFDLKILLNSGDEILVTASNLYYTEESNLDDRS